MTQERLLQRVTSILIMAGYDVSERCGLRPRSFDLIAGNDKTLLIIRVVSHIDSIGEDSASDIALIARYLKGQPLIIGEKTRDAELERGVVYLRYGILATSSTTLYDFFVEKVPPLVYAQPGGLYVQINGSLLRQVREGHEMSLGDLASALGVSRRTISKYESGMSTTLDIAIRLEEIFDVAIVEAINLLSHEHACQEKKEEAGTDPFPRDMERIGMEIHAMQRAPFQALAVYEEEIILTGYGPVQKMVRHAALIGNLSGIANSRAVCVVTDYKKKKKVGKTLVIGEEELANLEYGSELIELIDG